MTAQQERTDVLHRATKLHGKEGAESCHVKSAGLTQDAVRGEARDLPRCVDHRVKRITHHNQHCVGGVLRYLSGDVLHDLDVHLNQIISTHSRLAWHAGGDDHHVGISGVCVVRCSLDVGVKSLKRTALRQIQGLALRNANAVRNVNQHDVAKLLRCSPVGASCSNVSSSDD